jgi:RNA polymerase sigma-70 factor (ECF subfamily)
VNVSDTVGAAGAELAASDFETIFAAHYEPVARAIARVVRDHGRAEELAVETFLKLRRHPEAHGDRVRGWLHRTAVRLALDELRRRARRARYESLFPWGQSSRGPDELFSASQEQGRVRAVLASLPVRDAELLLLRHDGASYGELASTLALNPASIGTLLSRAQQTFRKEYVKRYGER